MSKLIFLCLGTLSLTLSGCATPQFTIAHPTPCSSLVPEANKKDVPGAPLPVIDGNESWFKFGDSQTGQLDKANKRNTENLALIQKCEERDRSIVVKPKGRFIGIHLNKK